MTKYMYFLLLAVREQVYIFCGLLSSRVLLLLHYELMMIMVIELSIDNTHSNITDNDKHYINSLISPRMRDEVAAVGRRRGR